MTLIKNFLLISSIFCLFSAPVFAEGAKKEKAESKTQSKDESGDDATSDTFQCERFKAETMFTLKAKLLDACNLNKPYSFSSVGDALGSNGSMVYCCHKK